MWAGNEILIPDSGFEQANTPGTGGTDHQKLHDRMLVQRDLVPNSSAKPKTLDYSRKRCVALMLYLDDGTVPTYNKFRVNPP